jgi:hypothetical protein
MHRRTFLRWLGLVVGGSFAPPEPKPEHKVYLPLFGAAPQLGAGWALGMTGHSELGASTTLE